jgi:hypothetical protein
MDRVRDLAEYLRGGSRDFLPCRYVDDYAVLKKRGVEAEGFGSTTVDLRLDRFASLRSMLCQSNQTALVELVHALKSIFA